MLRSAFRSILPRTVVLPRPSTSIATRSFYRTARPQTFIHRPPHLQIPTQTRLFSSTPRTQAQYVKFGGKPDSKWDITKLNSRYGVLFVIMGVGGLYYVTHLEQVPETGRWRFMDVNPKYETKLGEAARDELLREYQGKILPPNHPVTRHVRRVLTRLLDANDLGTLRSSSAPSQRKASPDDLFNPDVESGRTEDVAPGVGGREWELLVVNDDKVVNAAASYGNVLVFTGILPVAKDEEGLAAVLGHEIAHVVARHNSERYSSMKVLIFLAYLLEIIGLDFGVARIATTLLLDLPNSRTLEYEADKVGLRLLAKACYDPRASPEMFSRLGKMEGKNRWDFLYTHPTSEKRIKQLQEMLPEAYAMRAASPVCGGVADAFGAFSESFGSGFGGFPASRW